MGLRRCRVSIAHVAATLSGICLALNSPAVAQTDEPSPPTAVVETTENPAVTVDVAPAPTSERTSIGKASTAPKNDSDDWAYGNRIVEFLKTVEGIVIGIAAVLAALSALFEKTRGWWTVAFRVAKRLPKVIPDEVQRNKGSKLALEELQQKIDKFPAIEEIMGKYPETFTRQIELGHDVNRELNSAAKMIVVASGKGGVGKSTLALGLLEACCCKGHTTLLIDFDMHNRGLTSLLKVREKLNVKTSCFNEAKRFHAEIFPSLHLDDASVTPPQPGTNGHSPLIQIMKQFAEDAAGVGLELHAIPLLESDCYVEGAKVFPRQPWFLPSLRKGEHFLGSEMFEFGANEVFYFLKFLQYWATHCSLRIDRIVVDCHGAHDLLMIGAIHAAAGLVIATTPEPGAFDGTYDLIAFANLLRSNQVAQFPTVLVINNCDVWQADAAKAIESFSVSTKAGLSIDRVVQVPSSTDIRELTSSYSFGSASRRTGIWAASQAVMEVLEKGWSLAPEEKQIGTPATIPSAASYVPEPVT